MRDKGFDFYLQDMYAENLFAKHFTIDDRSKEEKYKCLTTFEVFEHLENPKEEIDKMFQLSDTIIFSTELQPDINFKDHKDWWYFVPEVGQHISFYSRQSLDELAKTFKCNLFTNGSSLHMLTRLEMEDPFVQSAYIQPSILKRIWNKFFKTKPVETTIQRESFLNEDFQKYKNILHQNLPVH